MDWQELDVMKQRADALVEARDTICKLVEEIKTLQTALAQAAFEIATRDQELGRDPRRDPVLVYVEEPRIVMAKHGR